MIVAAAQVAGAGLHDAAASWPRVEGAIRRAAAAGAALVVLPECAWPAYVLCSRAAYDEARRAGLPAPSAFLDHIAQLARALAISVCVGFVEESGTRLFNAAAVFAPDGRLCGISRKRFLWDFDREWFSPGDSIRPIDTPLGRIGVMICADARLPEIAATLAARGAELIIQPTAWVNAGTPERPWNPQPEFLIPSRASEFGVPIVSASKWGRESQTDFVGSSLICDADGRPVARCGGRGDDLALADVQPRRARRTAVTADEAAELLLREPPLGPAADVGDLIMEIRNQRIADATRAAARSAGAARVVLKIGAPAESAVELSGPGAGTIELAGARVAVFDGRAAERFAPARVAARRGAHLAIFFGDVGHEHVRTRAAENRIFAARVAPDGVTVYDPRGQPVGAVGADDSTPHIMRLALGAAVTKRIAAQTDALAGTAELVDVEFS